MEQKRKSWLACFVTLVLVFGLAGSAFAANEIYWDGGGGDNYLTTPENWVGDVLPVLGADPVEYAMLDTPGDQPLVAAGINASFDRVVIGQYNSVCTLDVTGGSLTSFLEHFTVGRKAGGNGILNISGGDVIANEGFIISNNADATGTVNMTGGTLTVHASSDPDPKRWYRKMLTIGDSGPGTFNMDGGAVTVDMDMWLAFRATSSGNLNMTGGTIDVAGSIYLDYNIHGSVTGIWGAGAAPGAIQLDGGVITASDLVMTADGSLDLTEGKMILDGDDTLAVWEYVDAGLITGYGSADNVRVGYDVRNDETILVAVIPEPATLALLGLGGLLSLRRRRTS